MSNLESYLLAGTVWAAAAGIQQYRLHGFNVRWFVAVALGLVAWPIGFVTFLLDLFPYPWPPPMRTIKWRRRGTVYVIHLCWRWPWVRIHRGSSCVCEINFLLEECLRLLRQPQD